MKEEPLDLGAGPVEDHILAEAFVPLSWKKDLWVIGTYEDPYAVGSDGDSGDDYGYDDSEEDDGERDGPTDLDVAGTDSDDDDSSLGYEYESWRARKSVGSLTSSGSRTRMSRRCGSMGSSRGRTVLMWVHSFFSRVDCRVANTVFVRPTGRDAEDPTYFEQSLIWNGR